MSLFGALDFWKAGRCRGPSFVIHYVVQLKGDVLHYSMQPRRAMSLHGANLLCSKMLHSERRLLHSSLFPPVALDRSLKHHKDRHWELQKSMLYLLNSG